MVLYRGDDLSHFRQCLASIENSLSLVDHPYHFKLCIQTDGYIDDRYRDVIGNYQNRLDIDFQTTATSRGLTINLNEIISANPHSEFYFRIDPDDLVLKERFRQQLSYMRQNPKVLMIGSSATVIDSKGLNKGEKKMPEGISRIRSYYKVRNPFIHSSACIRRQFFDEVGTYNEEYIKSQDYELWSRAISKGVVVANHGTLISLRVSKQQKIRRKSLTNISLEFLISLKNIIETKSYHLLPVICVKMIFRLTR
jgi:hypothetical protein